MEKKAYPVRLRSMSLITGKGYCLHLTNLFNCRKLLIQQTLPSFFGTMKEGDVHELRPDGSKTPNFTRCINSFLKVSRCILGTGKVLHALVLHFVRYQYETSCVDVRQEFHRKASHVSRESYVSHLFVFATSV